MPYFYLIDCYKELTLYFSCDIHSSVVVKKIFLFALIFPMFSCDLSSRKTAEALFLATPDDVKLYDFKSPDAKYMLPYVLEEISGLTYYKDGLLACVQDEDGKVFFYNHKDRKMDREVRFAGSGDYEGLEIIGDAVYVVKSNGDLYFFELGEDDQVKADKIETPLNKDNDIEGLAYDHEEDELILACKGNGDIKDRKVAGRAFYRYDLREEKLKKKPVFNITKEDIKAFLETQIDFEYEAERINFRPSGIAFHPIQNLYYVIASTGKLLLMVDRKGNVKGSVPIDPRLLGQPEGICFAPNGDMFISSEGQGDKGYILKFSIRK